MPNSPNPKSGFTERVPTIPFKTKTSAVANILVTLKNFNYFQAKEILESVQSSIFNAPTPSVHPQPAKIKVSNKSETPKEASTLAKIKACGKSMWVNAHYIWFIGMWVMCGNW